MSGIVFLLLLLLSHAAHAESWPAVIHRCAAGLVAERDCGSCAAIWPDVARCAGRFYPEATPERIEICIQRVNTRAFRMPMSHDRALDVITCLGEL